MIKKTALEEFRNLRKNGLIAIALKENDVLIGVRLSTGDDAQRSRRCCLRESR